MDTLWIAGLYVLSAILTYGITFGHFQNKYPDIAREDYSSDMICALVFSLLGPLGLFVVLFTSGVVRYGTKWK